MFQDAGLTGGATGTGFCAIALPQTRISMEWRGRRKRCWRKLEMRRAGPREGKSLIPLSSSLSRARWDQ